MNPCSKCGNTNNAKLVIFTETTFGHGDSTHRCYLKCTNCNNTAKEEQGWGLFRDDTFRKAVSNWNDENQAK